MTEKLHEALAWSLEEIEHGRMSVDDCLTRYPHYRSELEELLLSADLLRKAPTISPSLGFKMNARAKLVKKLDVVPGSGVTFGERIRRTVRGRYGPTSVRRRPAMSWLLISAIVLSVFTGGGVGLAFAADGAVPGDALYGLDLGVEELRMMFAFDPQTKAELALHFSDERLEELQELLGQGAPEEAIGEALAGYAHSLEQALQATNMVMAGDGEQAGELLRLLIQQKFMIQNQLLNQIRNQTSAQNQGQVEEAMRTMENTRTRVEEMFSAGEGGPPDDSPGGPPDDSPGGPSDDSPGGPSDNQGGDDPGGPGDGGNPDAPQGGPSDDAQSEGQQSGPFENENEALRQCMEEVEALVGVGDTVGLSQASVRCGETIEGMVASIAAANQGDTQQASIMAGMLDETLDEALPLLNSLLANAPASAGTYLNQIIEKCEFGKQELDRMFGNGYGGPGEQSDPHGTPGGKGN
jgi:hypothetical protein